MILEDDVDDGSYVSVFRGDKVSGVGAWTAPYNCFFFHRSL